MAEFRPHWERVCEEPDIHRGWAHVHLSFGHSHDYWCKFCPGYFKREDDRQMEFDFDHD